MMDIALQNLLSRFFASSRKGGSQGSICNPLPPLTALEEKLKRVKNYHIAVTEKGHELVFLRKMVPGATDKSYGIHVARLAGVPEKVIERANEILEEIEKENVFKEAEDGEKGKIKKSEATSRISDDAFRSWK